MKTPWSSLGRGLARAARWTWSSAMVVLVGTPRLRPHGGGAGGMSSAEAEARLRTGARAQSTQMQTGFFPG